MNAAINIVPIPAPQKESPWVKTPFANLVRLKSNGKYYVRARINNRLVRKCLKTKSVEIAKRKLDKLMEQERLSAAPSDGLDYQATFGQVAKIFERDIQDNPKLKENSKRYRLETLNQLWATWPKLFKRKVRSLTEQEAARWAKGPARVKKVWRRNKETRAVERFNEKYSPVRFNGTLETLRRLIKISIDNGLILDDPTVRIERASVPLKERHLPDQDQLKQLFAKLDSIPSRKPAARFIRVMLFTMMRRSAVAKLLPQHIDLGRNEIIRPTVKYDAGGRIPMIPEMRTLAEQLLKDYAGKGPLIPISDPRKALRTCCRLAGIPRLTNHDFRHIGTTQLIEMGVDIPTIAKLRGDRDGGAMLLKVYSHPRDKHSHEQAAKIKFL